MFLNIFDTYRLKNFMLIFAGVLFLDQALKNVFLTVGNVQKNYGALFGVEIGAFHLCAVFFLFLFFVVFYFRNKNNSKILTLPFALILSGIASNFADKIRFGFIIDYINFLNIFMFNLADIAILTGAIFFIWQIIKE